jgi:hypothetical protein
MMRDALVTGRADGIALLAFLNDTFALLASDVL